MPYAPPTITAAGLSIPSYTDIFQYLLEQYKAIFGSSVSTDNSNADVQIFSIIALAAADTAQALQLEYNNRAPNFAIGAALDSLVSLNGLTRQPASASTITLIIAGTAGSTISNGVVKDSIFGYRWDLPALVTIGGGGTVAVTAICETLGAALVPPSSAWSIVTPTAGWTGATNSAASLPGQPAESDSQLRARQGISTELPAITPLAATIAAILAVPGVTRLNDSPVLGGSGTPSIENFTGSADSWGNPAHSISAVVEGGTDLAVATAIFGKRGIGPNTNGSTGGTLVTVNVTDPKSGIVIPIHFARPTAVPIYIIVNAHPVAGGTLSADQITAIQAGLAAYLNGLQIGEVVSFGELIQAAAAAVNSNPLQPAVSIRSPFLFGTAPTPATSTDVAINFYQVAQGIADNTHIVVNSV